MLLIIKSLNMKLIKIKNEIINNKSKKHGIFINENKKTINMNNYNINGKFIIINLKILKKNHINCFSFFV